MAASAYAERWSNADAIAPMVDAKTTRATTAPRIRIAKDPIKPSIAYHTIMRTTSAAEVPIAVTAEMTASADNVARFYTDQYGQQRIIADS
jgi:hypothetical protein